MRRERRRVKVSEKRKPSFKVLAFGVRKRRHKDRSPHTGEGNRCLLPYLDYCVMASPSLLSPEERSAIARKVAEARRRAKRR